ncbi:arginine/ornithine antiporter [Thermoanaerobacterium xylanolyticum LX-11]|uniref:Arginine/ornithine antiporter n=1 Tax=Thermoanaerobacterium xylanolyticum (strain ATCC 49914 / DSM 7097 / LX-11) TaxID=858215 RepID=F6BFF7_THEXL|nr:basic amino acid/polyamine antiporter [Thermoanaerobacterium xylanolyticum]AEF16235.1 arginine/ornithine antiporter [Thermoanaerobacterium xylanolyticum LX-11]
MDGSVGKQKKLGLMLLIALGVGSMIGGGIFNSPTDLIGVSNPQSALIAWLIGGIGIVSLALVFQMLANKRPSLTGGIYSYARAGFGEFVGFNSAWGYWLSAWLGNVAFLVLLFKTFNSLLGKGHELKPVVTFIVASILLWIIHYIITRGIKDAGVVNAIVTVAKLLPLILVIIFGLIVFKVPIFNVHNWTTTLASDGSASSLIGQIKGAMGTILWCFIGVEAATVLSERAESQKIVGKATVLSILITLLIYMLISTIAMGVVPAKVLAKASTPLANVLQATILGGAGGVIVKLGLIVSLLGATLSWILLAAEIPYVAAKDGVMPKWFSKENKNGVPINSLILTNVLTQIFLVSLLSDKLQSAYYTLYYMATTLILVPYLFSALFSLKVCNEDKSIVADTVISLIATIYSLYVIYAVGISYLGLAFIMYAIGIIPYYIAKRERGEKVSKAEVISMIIMILIAIIMIYEVATGKITP